MRITLTDGAFSPETSYTGICLLRWFQGSRPILYRASQFGLKALTKNHETFNKRFTYMANIYSTKKNPTIAGVKMTPHDKRCIEVANSYLPQKPEEQSEARWDAIADLMLTAAFRAVCGYDPNQFHVVHGLKPHAAV